MTVYVNPQRLGDRRCAALVKESDGNDYTETRCGRLATDNMHRGDPDCADPELHRREHPLLLHHPFEIVAEQEDSDGR